MNEERIVHRNPVEQTGFARVSHLLTLDATLSDGAYRTYALLLKYAHQADGCYPGIERLAQDLARGERSISRYLGELGTRGLITRQQRLGTSAMTWLEDLSDVYDANKFILAKYGEDESAKYGVLSLPNVAGKEEAEKKKQKEEKEELAGGSILCSLHNVEMQQRGKDGQTWYSHKLSDGTWCKGEPDDQPGNERELDTRKYITGEFADYIQH